MLERKEQVLLTRIFRFSASHRLFMEGLSDEENFAIFDKCANPAGHGHDYTVEVAIGGEIDNETGMLINRMDFEKQAAPVIEELNYKWIDRDIDFFQENISTVENIGRYLWQKFEDIVPGRLNSIKVWENPKSYFEYFEEKQDG
ncbi:MAG: 6-carboxytetrahydropterin synthase [Candidatus Dadabacteria bacterium]|nr:6-carboxytetrahydropterin synthase [Candidatus Dadabacteria bacterium]MDE0663168.1 6-carboxytetrahydropterin synthase [Candidatus Dadabacteria bacterium]